MTPTRESNESGGGGQWTSPCLFDAVGNRLYLRPLALRPGDGGPPLCAREKPACLSLQKALP